MTDNGLDSLLERAHAHRVAGRSEQAIALIERAIALGGEERAYARTSMADLLFSLGREQEAGEQLMLLRTEQPRWSAPCQLVAELAQERGDHAEALDWYDLAVASLPDDELVEMDGLNAPYCYANSLMTNRRTLRRTMGRPSDDWDNMTIERS
ncbi:tetratricopeptide repeat protein [Actinokineospora enzanensis]|uniref:tetratricopeptide repeat protein n=1 Tax=Actinokineospora enzanensis TaxID=155975 RepID=UPI000382B54B|nr:tetratricopeptide repeat protein [Actinokineospora enzanensis]